MGKEYDVVIIGGGPGGYTAAIRAAQLGMSVACVDKNSALGGTCLRVGCIPSKTMLESSQRYQEARTSLGEHGIQVGDVQLDLSALLARQERVVTTLTRGIASLFKKNKVTHYQGQARLAGPGKIVVEGEGEAASLQARSIILATGSRPATLPGVELDYEAIGTSTQALSYEEVPEHFVVIGAGYIGLEIGSVWQRLGAKVTVLEYLDRILPGMDADLAREAQKLLAKQGLEFRLGQEVIGARRDGEGCIVEVRGAEPIRCDRVLLAVGRTPYTEGLGLETVGIKPDETGRIPVNERFETAAEGVFAVGDLIRGPMLAHKAEQEGIACVEGLAGKPVRINYDAIPAVVYTNPELASVGRTEAQLKEEGIPYNKGEFPFRGNGRARTLGEVDGKVKILAHADTDRLLGVHIIGPRAGDLIAEAVTAMEFGASSEDLALCSHAHPTLSEAVKEAALAVTGSPIHM